MSAFTLVNESLILSFSVKESGDILKLKAISNDEALLLCNHQSTSDIPIAMLSLYTKGEAAGHVMWIMDHVFRLTHFGWMSQCHGDYFLKKPGGVCVLSDMHVFLSYKIKYTTWQVMLYILFVLISRTYVQRIGYSIPWYKLSYLEGIRE